jgi:hypothetical protein
MREITLGMDGGLNPRRNPSDLEGFERKWSMRCERGEEGLGIEEE